MTAKAFHIILAFLLLLSSTGLVVSKHYCRGELKSIALFIEATPCHQQKQMKHCPMHGSMASVDGDQQGCCDTQTEFVKDDNPAAEVLTSTLADTPALVALLAVMAGLPVIHQADEAHPFFTYKPPLLVYDRPVRLQTFLC